MVNKEINGHKVIFYDSVEDLPVTQFHRYSKYLLVEGGIGDTIQDIDRHITRIINFLNDTKKAYQEILNLQQCLFLWLPSRMSQQSNSVWSRVWAERIGRISRIVAWMNSTIS